MAANAERVLELFPEVKSISNSELAQKVVDIWVETWEASGWRDPMDVPKTEEAPERSLVPHTQGVTQQAIAIAEIVEKIHGIEVNRDLLIAASLLHDVSKMMENDSSAPSPAYKKSKFGKLINHGAYGAFKALEKGLSVEMVHTIITHTHSSSKPPATLEGAIIHYADMADSDALLWAAGKKMIIQKRW